MVNKDLSKEMMCERVLGKVSNTGIWGKSERMRGKACAKVRRRPEKCWVLQEQQSSQRDWSTMSEGRGGLGQEEPRETWKGL